MTPIGSALDLWSIWVDGAAMTLWAVHEEMLLGWKDVNFEQVEKEMYFRI